MKGMKGEGERGKGIRSKGEKPQWTGEEKWQRLLAERVLEGCQSTITNSVGNSGLRPIALVAVKTWEIPTL